MAGRKVWLWYFDTACLLVLHWKDLNEGAEMGGFGGVNLFAQGSLLHSISPDFCRRFHISSKGKSVPLEAKRAPSSSRS